MRWEIVATDGHLESGVFAFGVGTGRPPPQAASFSGSDQDWRYLLARAAYFAGLLLLIGGVVYRVLVFAPVLESEPAEPRPMMSLRERHRANQVLAASAVLTLAGGWVALTIQGADVAGVTFWEAFDHRGPVASALDATRFGREFGRGIDVTAAFTVSSPLAYAAAPYGRRIALGLLGIPAACSASGRWPCPGSPATPATPAAGCWRSRWTRRTSRRRRSGPAACCSSRGSRPTPPAACPRPSARRPHGDRQAVLGDRADQRDRASR